MQELIANLATQMGLSKANAKAFLLAALDGVTERMVHEGRIKLGDFGSFELRQRKERKGRNPRTGEQIIIPASMRAVFKPGARLKEQLAQIKELPQKKEKEKGASSPSPAASTPGEKTE
jgi:DNA-binding protein HU-beta